jgi:hypothetical protein
MGGLASGDTGLADDLDGGQGGVPGSVGAGPLIDGAPAESRSASAFARKSRREMLNLSLSAHDPLRTSMDPPGCVVRSIQPTLPGSGVISQSNWIPRCSSPCPPQARGCANLPQ